MKIGVGIPIFQNLAPQVAFDYMRMFYSFGRRYPDHEFFLLSRVKSEQFRARNAIVEAAMAFGLDYLLFLDDDHIINWKETGESSPYDFLQKLLAHKVPIVGCLYYHRTGNYKPVVMKEFEPGKFRFLTDAEITGELQEVDVQGGGCMLIDMKIFKKLKPPYFYPEQQANLNAECPECGTEFEVVTKNFGTDVQICKAARDAGFKVYCDTSIVIGHLKQESEVVTHLNRDAFYADNLLRQGVTEDWAGDFFIAEYQKDIEEYLGMDAGEINDIAVKEREVNAKNFHKYDDIEEYYRNVGKLQLCRQYFYHSKPSVIKESINFLKRFRKGMTATGIDYCCGSAPVGYELLRMGHHIDFIDIDGAASYEFLKWRIENKLKPEYRVKAGFTTGGPYDFALMLDAIEHLKDWEEVLDNVIGRLKEGSMLITNYFGNTDYDNVEHISMDKKAVMEFLVSRNMMPRTYVYWQKDDNYMGAINNAAIRQQKQEQVPCQA